MSTIPPARTHLNADPKLIEEFLNKGGQVTKFKYGQRSEEINYTQGFYGRGRKKAAPAAQPTDEEEDV